MKQWLVIFLLLIGMTLMISFTNSTYILQGGDPYTDSLRTLYAQPSRYWPVPDVDAGVPWQELDSLPDAPLKPLADSLKDLIALGKLLFFDPRLSSSGQISCASCHAPDLSWADGREKAVGHDQQVNQRNTPSLENVWYFKKLFWDGRSSGLEDQVFGPVNNAKEMHGDMQLLPSKLKAIKGYQVLFRDAFASDKITAPRIAKAIATYEQTITSRKTRLDLFLAGYKNALSDGAVRGLHLYRTKARCMNCHYGPLMTDNDFHNIGLTYYGRLYQDLGRYNVTGRAADVGKFKTPSLRDVIRTRPWMHNGLFDDINGVINMYSAGMPQPKPRPDQLGDTLFPKTDPLIKRLNLTKVEKEDLIEFLNAVTTVPWKVRIPALPQ
ncbi:cytochrome c peroxidase [Chitinophaga costaii]|uniref:Methylamine utilization protein MauG n=1 Tax=Chitinophaga costaii TaxID=1335309 RepID=A0A1C4FZ38_9BACT|nr:cytochrome c peroxidase [Chitinophaga costaii]PUZ20934.1 cytochrome-c peroxidase [Chitinophaga costaii]SCC61134.1 cytochrome c peroxidase [Chitinophaga costaii]